jgi:drug/metabolite transporter (DMT)-like permease
LPLSSASPAARPAEAAARPGLAALWMTGAIVSFMLMAVGGRAVSAELDTFEIMMYRSVVGFVLVILVAGAMRKLHEVTTRDLHVQALRNVFHFTGQNLWFWAITMAPLAQVFALEFTSPIWVTLLAPLVLGERLTRTRLLAAVLGFVGILIVARPGVTEISPGVIAAAASAIGFAGSILLTKKLTRTETITCILFWLTVMQSVFGLVTAGWDGDIALPSAVTAPWLLMIGCAGIVAHLCLTQALRVAPAAVVVPMDFVRLPAIAVVGMLLYGEPLEPWVFLGAIVIFGANYLNIWTETRRVTVS